MKILENLYMTKDGSKCNAIKVTNDNVVDLYGELYKICNDIRRNYNAIILPYYKNGEFYDYIHAFPGDWIVLCDERLYKYSEDEFSNTFTKITKTIRIKYLSDKIEKLGYIAGKSDWIDLRAAEEIDIKAGEFKLIPLGIAMELPKGYEAHVVPRSSSYKNYGIIQTNSMGVIDETYCGDGDQWFMPVLAMRDTHICVNDRVCQFRIMKHQPPINFEETDCLNNDDRGGHGSTGKQ